MTLDITFWHAVGDFMPRPGKLLTRKRYWFRQPDKTDITDKTFIKTASVSFVSFVRTDVAKRSAANHWVMFDLNVAPG
ncbi:hypothetical protein [Primorskyibacter flagellatus]|uniref:hypothetical protein n=1 Tax=Primorskyibacter flagellatus TaxID=1387277 RepID=UPI000A007A03|nr:hypothetical protein [Primorskyibacter flagellatus]